MSITLPKPGSEITQAEPRQATPKEVLMCRPEFFTVSYRINPWMFPDNPTDTSKALGQWESLVDTYHRLGITVHLIDPVSGLPDMVYSANGALTIDGVAYGVKFRHDERGPEAAHYLSWLRDNGFRPVPASAVNEGEGDFLPVGSRILAAHGFRSDLGSHRELEDVFDTEVVSLRLVRPDFYHLDTALAVLDDDTIAYLPSAFDDQSQQTLNRLYPDAIIAGEDDAAWLGLNLFSDGKNVVMATQATDLAAAIAGRGFSVFPVDMSELLLGGGGVKCCTLELRLA
jgi:N-dimethylarginine dimethylaminohydrolase